MRIIIDISEDKYKWIKEFEQVFTSDLEIAVRNGIPLNDDTVNDKTIKKLEHIRLNYPSKHIENIEADTALYQAIQALKQQRCGHWTEHEEGDGMNSVEYWCECSECHSERAYKTNFCPDCGAKMI